MQTEHDLLTPPPTTLLELALDIVEHCDRSGLTGDSFHYRLSALRQLLRNRENWYQEWAHSVGSDTFAEWLVRRVLSPTLLPPRFGS